MSSVPDGSGWSGRRSTRRGSTPTTSAKGARPAFVDLTELDAWNQQQTKARDAYYGSDADEYARRIAASEKAKRHQRARKEKK